jgi:hypothetical protein
MFVIEMPSGLFVRKSGAMNDFVRDVEDATKFRTKEEAECGKPGHHRDMGGTGFKGTIRSLNSCRRGES